jgi:hypothetical protein
MKKIGNRIIVELTDSADRYMRESVIEHNAGILAAALAESDAPLVVVLDGGLTVVTAGQRVLVNLPALQQAIDEYLCTAAVVNHGTTEKPHWVLEAQPITMPHHEDTLRRLLAGREKREGGLRCFVPQARAIDLAGERAVA